MKKLLALLLTLCMVTILFAGCGNSGNEGDSNTDNNSIEDADVSPGDDKPEKITVVMSSEGSGPMLYAMEEFENRTGIKVEVMPEAYDNIHNKIMTMVTGGGDCDIVSLDTVWPAEFAKAGLILPLDEYLDDGFDQQFVDIAIDQLRYDGKLYGVPTGNDGKWLYYNKEALEKAGYSEPPKTWKELEGMSLEMKEKGIVKYGIAWGASQAEGLVCDWTSLLYGFGGAYRENDLEASGNWKLNSKESVEALTWFAESMKNGVSDPASVTYNDRTVLNTFMAGDVAFITNWSSAWTTANNEDESAIAGKVGMAMIPGSDNAVSGSVSGGGGFAVVSTTKSAKWSVEFIKLLCEPDMQARFLRDISQMPTLTSCYEDAALKEEFEILELAYPQYEYAHNRPILVQYTEWSNLVQEALHKVLVQNADVPAVMDKLVEDINNNISE